MTNQIFENSELRYRRLFESAQDGILILNAATGMIEDVNPFLMSLLGYSREEFIQKKLWEVGAFKDIDASKEAFQVLQEKQYIRYKDLPLKAKDGKLKQVEFVSNVYLVGEEKVIQCNIRDITDRIQAEQEIANLAKFPFENPNPILRMSPDGTILYANPASTVLMNTWDSTVGSPAPPFWQDLAVQAITDRENKLEEIECAGKVYSINVTPIPESGYVNLYGQDITALKQGEERILRQLAHLTSLSVIDRIIAANFDLQLSLSEILTHVTIDLGIDAADILTNDPNSHFLKYAAERGFRTKVARESVVRLGESYAGRVAMDHQIIQIPNLKGEPENVFLQSLIKNEGFASYFGVPLMIKGQVKGVLEVFHRTVLNPDAEWFNFLNSLAGQTAIAIENSALFESLQRSNSELTQAYDATIEGWSRALDLRDNETEWHTLRVTKLTVDLTRTFGLNEEELVQVRWGALLHDIGKMGIPDNILHKPGPLTDEEWVVMKKHPVFAYQMLSPITYLHAALDIPYCHHEKWDGTGYPQ
jgi:PAS domain S-box-containing protein/putative nucleotidyltransferase with HDIG domain